MLDYYIIDNFIDEKYIDRILKNMEGTSCAVLDGKVEKHLVGYTDYQYYVYRDNIRDDDDIKSHVFDKLNFFYNKELGKTCNTTEINPLNFFTKKFEPNKSFYNLHTEDPQYFGDIVFMLYLSDEVDGELVLPSFEDSKELWTDGFNTMMQNIDIKFVENSVKILPKRNRCVFVKVGLAHYVKPCSGHRYTLSGWSFASDEYYKRFYEK
jgi:hypothetical protein